MPLTFTWHCTLSVVSGWEDDSVDSADVSRSAFAFAARHFCDIFSFRVPDDGWPVRDTACIQPFLLRAPFFTMRTALRCTYAKFYTRYTMPRTACLPGGVFVLESLMASITCACHLPLPAAWHCSFHQWEKNLPSMPARLFIFFFS